MKRLRSVLFAPAVRSDFVPKLTTFGTDAVVIDCEDGTPVQEKDRGRKLAIEAVRTLSQTQDTTGHPWVLVRINSISSPWFSDDISQLIAAGVTDLVVPKIESQLQLDELAQQLDTALEKLSADNPEVTVMAGIETCLGVADARQLLAHHRITAAYFGAEDYIADLGGRRTDSNHEVAAARSTVALAARLAGVPVVDQIVAKHNDHDRFTQETNEARDLGYSGKMCIHPSQVTLANAAFVPSADEVTRASRLLDDYHEACRNGASVVSFEGQMVDGPIVAQAERVIELASDYTSSPPSA